MNSKQRYAEYLQTDYWKEVTSRVKKRAGWKCQVCNSPHDLQAHHRTYEHRGNEINHLDDLICMCRRCHRVFHGVIEEMQNQESQKAGGKRAKREMRMKSLPTTESLMPEGTGPIVLTKELIMNCSSSKCGFTSATTSSFGLIGRLKSGWKKRLIGREISRGDYRKALEGRFIFV